MSGKLMRLHRGLATRKKNMEIKVSKMEIDLRHRRLYKKIGPRLRDLYVNTVESQHKARPTPSTIRRRGGNASQFFKVTGNFLADVDWERSAREMRLITGKLSPTVARWLQFRVAGVRARNLGKAANEIFKDVVGELIIAKGARRGRGR